jgi:hypothetical protein
MKRILLFILLFCYHYSLSQLEFRNSNVGRLVNMEGFDGRPLLKKYDPDIKGSPFMNDNWAPAKITLSKVKEMGPVLVKFNLESNELHFLDSAGKELIAVEGTIKKVDFINYYSKDSIRYIFKTGYPIIDKQNENYFYQVFTEGEIELLASRFKYISTVKDAYSGEIKKDFVEGGTVLYVFANNTLQVFHPKKDFIISLLKSKEQEITRFIDSNKLNLKKTKDIIRLFNYYNGL